MTGQEILLVWGLCALAVCILWIAGDLWNSTRHHSSGVGMALLHTLARLPIFAIFALLAWPLLAWAVVRDMRTNEKSANNEVERNA